MDVVGELAFLGREHVFYVFSLRVSVLSHDDVAYVGTPLVVEGVVAMPCIKNSYALNSDGGVRDMERVRIAILQIEPLAVTLVYERDGGLCSRLDDQTCGGGRYVTLVEHVVMVIDETGCTVVVHSIFLLRTRWELHMSQHPCTREVDTVMRMLLIVGAGRKGEKQQKACDDVIIFHTIICF